MGCETSQSTWSMSTPALQQQHKNGSQASTAPGHYLDLMTCPAFSTGMPCQVWGPGCTGVAPGGH
eukprot:scaffold49384_cov31-Tisochrysis_lutea.AAC.1